MPLTVSNATLLSTARNMRNHLLFMLCRVNTTGVAVQQFVTTSPKLFEPYKDEDVHGGPPLIHVPAHLSSLGRDYFLGIFHFFKVSLLTVGDCLCEVSISTASCHTEHM
jgi:hypothetical protein